MAEGDVLFVGDRVYTDVKSGLRVILIDKSALFLGDNTEMFFESFTYVKKQIKGKLNLEKGRFWAIVKGAFAEKKEIDFEMSGMMGGIRGTSVGGVKTSEKEAFVLEKGRVEVSRKKKEEEDASHTFLEPGALAILEKSGKFSVVKDLAEVFRIKNQIFQASSVRAPELRATVALEFVDSASKRDEIAYLIGGKFYTLEQLRQLIAEQKLIIEAKIKRLQEEVKTRTITIKIDI